MITVRRICGSIVWSREGVQAGKQADGYAKEAVENLLSSFKDISEPYTFEVKFE